MFRFVSYPIGLIAVTLLSAAPATATTLLDRELFNATYPGLTVLDFEGIAPPGGDIPAPAFPGVNIEGASFGLSSSSPGLIAIVDAENELWADPTFTAPSDVAIVNSLSGWRMLVEFDEPAAAVGLDVNIGFADGPSTRIEAFNGDTRVANVTRPTSNAFDTFVGIAGVGDITRIEIHAVAQDRGNSVMIDNLTFGTPIPEPSTFVRLCIGTIGLLVYARRKRK
ncbi:MAG: PEP-CTERM sorting domain-containing protein [Candidatus Nealsonbacteria bacterium]|nr:PEP-CTERM sorting domain-containing protein [Candidatus Nealsonbacteria bacterium]